MADWDDEDFEPETSSLAPPPAPEPVQQSVKPTAPKKKGFNMESLGRELTVAEKEEMQRCSDFKLAKELFGFGEGDEAESVSYDHIRSKEQFEEWGTKVGTFLAKNHKKGHYGDLINKLILSVSETLAASELRKISTNLKALADTKKDDKFKTAVGNKKQKVELKGSGSKGSDYHDYEGGGKGASGSTYDNFDDDFM